MEKQADRLTHMIDEVLLYARTQSGWARYECNALSVKKVVDQALTVMSSSIEQAGAVITCYVPTTLPAVAADSVALSHCVQNLLSNAIKYGKREPDLFVRIHSRENAQDRMVELSVEDDGPGIAVSDLPHIFDPFFRGAHSHIPGSGLGLNLVRQMMQQQGGDITVRTQPGSGCCFTLRIPVARDVDS